MRILGIDFGTKKIGLALSDKTGKFAFPLKVLKFTLLQDVNLEIGKICAENEVEKIVLGKPEGYKGNPEKILKEIEKFKNILEKETCLPVFYENEVLTTQQAVRLQGRNEKTDASSAAIILQSYLDKQQKVL